MYHVSEDGLHELETAPDIIRRVEYGCFEIFIRGADGEEIGSGRKNTDSVLRNNCSPMHGGVTGFRIVEELNVNGFTDGMPRLTT